MIYGVSLQTCGWSVAAPKGGLHPTYRRIFTRVRHISYCLTMRRVLHSDFTDLHEICARKILTPDRLGLELYWNFEMSVNELILSQEK